MTKNWYPIIFKPIFKDRIWGGTKLQELLGKNITSTTIGESWELSSVAGDISNIANGAFKGESLESVITKFPEQILGEKLHDIFGNQFPLLFKFLDAEQDLSIQLHPNDALAKKRHNSMGKTEMWYVMQADKGARVIIGFKEESSPENYLYHLKNKSLVKILNEIEVKQGDVFFLETGTIHAIGAGVVIAEIQQTSDITYRVYDFDRKDANGNTRELHVDLALEAINYKTFAVRKEYSETPNTANPVVDSPFFTTNFLPLDGTYTKTKNTDTFVVYMCTQGNFTIACNNQQFSFAKGDTILIPAVITDYQIIGCATILEIYIS